MKTLGHQAGTLAHVIIVLGIMSIFSGCGGGSSNPAISSLSVNTSSVSQRFGNREPRAIAASIKLNESEVKSIILKGFDPDSVRLGYSITQKPLHGRLDGRAPNITYTPFGNYVGSDSFSFAVSDSLSTSAPATVSLTIEAKDGGEAERPPVIVGPGGNIAPTATAVAIEVAENSVKGITLAGIDPDSPSLGFSIAAKPLHGRLDGRLPNITYKPEQGFTGEDSFSFTVSDSGSTSAPAVVSLTVVEATGERPPLEPPVEPPTGGGNVAPIASPATIDVGVDEVKSITLSGTDPDSASLGFSIITKPQHGRLDGRTPNIIYTPSRGYTGVDSFSFTVSDSANTSAAATISLVVKAGDQPNVAPVAKPISQSIKLSTSANVILSATDADGDNLSYEIVSPPSKGSLGVLSGNSVTYTANATGSDSFTYKATDGVNFSNTATVIIEVSPVIQNNAPTANNNNTGAEIGVPLTISLRGSDVDGDNLTYEVVASPSKGSISAISGNSLTYTASSVGNDQFTFKVSDGKLFSNVATVSIVNSAVSSSNTAPTARHSSLTSNVNVPFTLSLIGNDADGDSLNYEVISGPSQGNLGAITGNRVTYTPNSGYKGNDSFTFKVFDGKEYSNNATVSIAIADEGGKVDISIDLASQISRTQLTGEMKDVLATNTHAFVAAGEAGLHIISKVFSRQPERIKTVNVGGYVLSIEFSADKQTLFIAADEAGLVIVDVSDPEKAKVVGRVLTHYLAENIALSSDEKTAYVADAEAGITIVDISNHSQPKLLGNLSAPNSGYARGIQVSKDNNFAYVASSLGGLNIFDVSNINQPTFVSQLNTGDTAYELVLSKDGNTAFVASGEEGVVIVDVSNPASPVKKGIWNDTPPSNILQPIVAVDVRLLSDGTSLLVATRSPGIYNANVTHHNSPVTTDFYDTPSFVNSMELSADEKTLLVTDFYFSLLIYDIRKNK